MGKIRVIRVIEYIYPDIEKYLEDQDRWIQQYNAKGKVKFKSEVVSVHSETDTFDWEEIDD